MEVPRFVRAVNNALGIRRYVILSFAFGIGAAYNFFTSLINAKFGYALPEFGGLINVSLIVLVILVFFLVTHISSIERKLEPKLLFEFENQEPFVFTTTQTSNGHPFRVIRVKLVNSSAVSLDNCLVKLEEMTNESGRSCNIFVPIGLKTQFQNVEQRPAGPFHLRAFEWKFIDVAVLDEADPGSQITLQYETDHIPSGVPRGSYGLLLRAYGGETPGEARFRLFVDQNARLAMERV
jgi:hypothetical protein